jgi:hypothetical protein
LQGRKIQPVGKGDAKEVMLQIEAVCFALDQSQRRLHQALRHVHEVPIEHLHIFRHVGNSFRMSGSWLLSFRCAGIGGLPRRSGRCTFRPYMLNGVVLARSFFSHDPSDLVMTG